MKTNGFLYVVLPTVLSVVLIAVVVAGCGPAAENHESQSDATVAQAGGSTPNPCPHTEGNYPKLDTALADLVGQYERCEKTETEAAAELAPLSDGPHVLVEVDVPAADGETVFTWMGTEGINPRHKYIGDGQILFIYAYVKVSELGLLSRHGDITLVRATENPLMEGATWTNPPDPNAGQPGVIGAASEPQPEFPWWLPGYDHPGEYPGIEEPLNTMFRAYQEGKASIGREKLLQLLREDEASACMFDSGDRIILDAVMHNATEQQYNDFVTWLKGQGITVDPDEKYTDTELTWYLVQRLIVPIDKTLLILKRPGVQSVGSESCINFGDMIMPKKGSQAPAGNPRLLGRPDSPKCAYPQVCWVGQETRGPL